MRFEYFYGGQSEYFSFYRIPRQLVTGAEFCDLSTDAKLLYGMMLDRMGLSLKNGWHEEDGRVYIYYTVEEIAEDLNCGREKAIRLVAELDESKGFGLIFRKRQGQGKPTKIYVKRFASREITEKGRGSEVGKPDFKKSEYPTSRGRKNRRKL